MVHEGVCAVVIGKATRDVAVVSNRTIPRIAVAELIFSQSFLIVFVILSLSVMLFRI